MKKIKKEIMELGKEQKVSKIEMFYQKLMRRLSNKDQKEKNQNRKMNQEKINFLKMVFFYRSFVFSF